MDPTDPDPQHRLKQRQHAAQRTDWRCLYRKEAKEDDPTKSHKTLYIGHQAKRLKNT
jgi:hypothetical protein